MQDCMVPRGPMKAGCLWNSRQALFGFSVCELELKRALQQMWSVKMIFFKKEKNPLKQKLMCCRMKKKMEQLGNFTTKENINLIERISI